MLPFNSATFKFSVSGLRGVYLKDITPEGLLEISKAFHEILKKGDIAIAQDTRNSSLPIVNLIIGALLSYGRNVHFLDVLPTPTLKSYVKDKKLVGGIMVTASHNPSEYNGLKFIDSQGAFFSSVRNNQLLRAIQNQDKTQNTQSKKQNIGCVVARNKEAVDAHIQQVLDKIPIDVKKLPKDLFPIAIDTLGATATKIAAIFFEKLKIPYVSMYPNLLNYFPRKAEPTKDALKKFSKFMVKNKAGIGFAFDPDADRLVVLNKNGVCINEENTFTLSLLHKVQHLKNPNTQHNQKHIKKVVMNFSSSWRNEWVANQYGVKLYRSKVGELNVVDVMKQKRAILGGEGNGGVIDPNISSYGRDSMVGLAYILSLLVASKKETLDSILSKIPKTYMIKIAIPIVSHQKKSLIENVNFEDLLKTITQKLCFRIEAEKEFSEYKVSKEDGIFLFKKKGIPWVHIRVSNTEPIIRCIIEAESKQSLKKIKTLCLSLLEDCIHKHSL